MKGTAGSRRMAVMAITLAIGVSLTSIGSTSVANAAAASIAHDSSTPICATYFTTPVEGCITPYSTGVVFSWTGATAPVTEQFYGWADQGARIVCEGPNYSVFVPLPAGSWQVASSLVNVETNATAADGGVVFKGVVVVGGTNTTPPPATSCIVPPGPIPGPVTAPAPAPAPTWTYTCSFSRFCRGNGLNS